MGGGDGVWGGGGNCNENHGNIRLGGEGAKFVVRQQLNMQLLEDWKE